MYEASRRREATVVARTRHDSVSDPSAIIDDAKRELYKVIHTGINKYYRYDEVAHFLGARLC